MNVLVTDRYTQSSLTNLASLPSVTISYSEKQQPSIQEMNNVQIMLTRSRTIVDKDFLTSAPQLKLIVTATSGFDHIDLEACRERDVTVCYTPDANTQSAAEHTLLLALSLLRQSQAGHTAIINKKWREDILIGSEIHGAHWGIIGLGRVGSRVAQLAQAFGAKVSAYDPYKDDNYFKEHRVERQKLSAILSRSDVLSLHTPLTSETENIINKSSLEVINPKCVLVNTSRGPVIDENELFLSLKNGRLAAAALDVFNTEPLPSDSNLRELKNLIMTPHIGAYTEQAFERASQIAVEKVANFLQQKPLSDLL